jgi:hypothetical protein
MTYMLKKTNVILYFWKKEMTKLHYLFNENL